MSAAGKSYWGPRHLPESFDLGPGRAALMMVRHSARVPVITAQDAFSAQLTEEGRAMAREFGAELGQKTRIGAVVASPVARCLDTARQILSGALNGSAAAIPVRPLGLLHFDQKCSGIAGLEAVYLNDPGFLGLVSRPESQEYALLRRSLLAALPFPKEPGVIHLAVTHDVLVAFLRASLLGLPNAALSDFPGYLEGLILVKQGDQISLL